ncbi:MAG: sulfite exporter TauE/SafE family protein [Thiotrichales bacterium]|nr:sulfite exporter TauE/SafE family protein [Thiotrichales bacterium]
MEFSGILIAALLAGLLGGVHCLGMCGGVVGALTFSLEVKNQASWWRMLPFQIAYNFGRIFSYLLLGGLFGALGALLSSLASLLPFQQFLQVFAGFFMIVLGLYLAGWWRGLAYVEIWGQGLWQRLAPYAQRMRCVKNVRQAALYGLLWGWLPCGLVYSMLILALSSGGALEGALVLLAFGLGTLPNLLLIGVFAFYFSRLARKPWVRGIAGLSVIAMGVWQIYLAMAVSVS